MYYTIQSYNLIFISYINQIKSSHLFQNHSMHQVNLNYNSNINMGEIEAAENSLNREEFVLQL